MEGDGFFFCCCEHEADDDSVRITPSARKGSPMRDAHLARYMSEGTPIQLPPAPEPARLRPIGNSSLSVQPPSPDVPKDKAYLVKKLNAQLEQFKTKAFAGMPVEVVNIENGRLNEYVFCFDRYFTVFSLKPRVDKRFNAKVRDFNLKNVVAVYRNCTHQLSTIDAKVTAKCVVVELNRADQRLYFYFDVPTEQTEFYQCLRICSMSVNLRDIQTGAPGRVEREPAIPTPPQTIQAPTFQL
eukprot:GEMP01049611.1.p1 GENE.GEMP01049611.1~~GEMP01049611.1.p1  ORF type:complete len:241 (+),score=46.28 GEMP01049611.1:140-862(+)